MSTEQHNPDPIPPPASQNDRLRPEEPAPEARPDDASSSTTAVRESEAPPPAETTTAVTPAPRREVRGREPVMRVPTFAPLAPWAGWLAAWGAAALAAASLEAAGVDLGLGLGIANATQLGVEDGLGAGLVLLIVQGGAFIFGGYVAARMARAAGLMHALLAWALAMLATGADALIQGVRGETSVVTRIPGIPYWIDTGLGGTGRLTVALGIFAVAALVGAAIGGLLGTAVNRAGRRDPADLVEPVR
jgi:hypothetical protein